MTDSEGPDTAFVVKDCVLAAIATGRRAQTLRELRDVLSEVHLACVYYHFWGTLLRPQFGEREFNNDFASWCRHSLHDQGLAERLAVIDPTDFPDLEGLRQEVLEVIEERLDESEVSPWARGDEQFHFTRSQIVVFDTHRRAELPEELATLIPTMSEGGIFYHFIDARRRTEGGVDDFRAWLMGFGEEHRGLCAELAEIDPYFDSLSALHSRLALLFKIHFGMKVA